MVKKKNLYIESLFLKVIFLVFFYIFIIFSPLLTYEDAHLYLLQNDDSILFGKTMAELINSYFYITLILVCVLPILCLILRVVLKNYNQEFIAVLSSFLIFLTTFIIFIYNLFSITLQKDMYKMDVGFYCCEIILAVLVLLDYLSLRQRIQEENQLQISGERIQDF